MSKKFLKEKIHVKYDLNYNNWYDVIYKDGRIAQFKNQACFSSIFRLDELNFKIEKFIFYIDILKTNDTLYKFIKDFYKYCGYKCVDKGLDVEKNRYALEVYVKYNKTIEYKFLCTMSRYCWENEYRNTIEEAILIKKKFSTNILLSFFLAETTTTSASGHSINGIEKKILIDKKHLHKNLQKNIVRVHDLADKKINFDYTLCKNRYELFKKIKKEENEDIFNQW